MISEMAAPTTANATEPITARKRSKPKPTPATAPLNMDRMKATPAKAALTLQLTSIVPQFTIPPYSLGEFSIPVNILR